MSPTYAKNILFTRLKATSAVRGTTMDSEKYIMSSEKLLFRQPYYPSSLLSLHNINIPLHNKTVLQKDAESCCDVDKSTSTILCKNDTVSMFENDYAGVHEERKKGELLCIKKSCSEPKSPPEKNP